MRRVPCTSTTCRCRPTGVDRYRIFPRHRKRSSSERSSQGIASPIDRPTRYRLRSSYRTFPGSLPDVGAGGRPGCAPCPGCRSYAEFLDRAVVMDISLRGRDVARLSISCGCPVGGTFPSTGPAARYRQVVRGSFIRRRLVERTDRRYLAQAPYCYCLSEGAHGRIPSSVPWPHSRRSSERRSGPPYARATMRQRSGCAATPCLLVVQEWDQTRRVQCPSLGGRLGSHSGAAS